jgi:hypothetical protein
MLLRLRVIWGIIRHDIRAYVESYRKTLEWAQRYPQVSPSDFDTLQDLAWGDLERELLRMTDPSKCAPVIAALPRIEELN